MAASGPEQRLELIYRQRPTPDGPHPGERLATSKRHEWETLDSSARDSTPGTKRFPGKWVKQLTEEHEKPFEDDSQRRSDERELVERALAPLTPKEFTAVVRSLGVGDTLREIGEDMGITEGRVSQLRTRALALLRNMEDRG